MISNKEGLRDKIHEIHNYLRNNGAGYGMNALKIFNIFYVLKKIEDNDLWKKLELPEECKYSNLIKKCDDADEALTEFIQQNLLKIIHNSKLNKWLFHIFSKNITANTFRYLIREINGLCENEKELNFQLCGKIYEYFIGRDKTAISELGAYFTDRHIIEYIYNLTKPEYIIYDDNTIELKTICDPFGGSGGFTLGYIKYIQDQLEENKLEINWEDELLKIHHYDVNEDVIKYAALEMFCMTHELPSETHLILKNSFKYCNKKFDYIYTNPPYGGDKNKKSDKLIKYDKLIKWIDNNIDDIDNYSEEDIENMINQKKQLKVEISNERNKFNKEKVSLDNSSKFIREYAKEHNLITNDKEGVSLIMLMCMLNKYGTSVGVLKEGVFFDRKYMNLRKHLLENFNVEYVVSVPQNAFENTSTKTSILVFHNNGKTNKIKFLDLKINYYENDIIEYKNNKVVLTENKGDIKEVNDIYVSTANVNELINNNYILIGKNYIKKELIINSNYKLVKINDIVKFMPKSKRPASFGKKEGKYLFYTSSQDKKLYCDTADYKDEYLLIGDGGNSNIKLVNNFSCSDHHYIIKSKYNKYLYHLLSSNIYLLENGFKGSTIKNLDKKYLEDLEIPIPKNKNDIIKWEDKLTELFNIIKKNENELLEIENTIKYEIINLNKNECKFYKLDDIVKFMPKSKRPASFGKKEGKYLFYTSSQDKKLYCDTADYKDEYLLIGDGGNSNIKLVNNFSCSDHHYIIKSKYNKYLYHLLNSNIDLLKIGFKGSTIKNLDKKYLENLKIVIPNDLKEFNKLFDKINEIKIEIYQNQKKYNKYLKELYNDIYN